MKRRHFVALALASIGLLGGAGQEARAQSEQWNRRYPTSGSSVLTDYGVGVKFESAYVWSAGLKSTTSTISLFQAIKYDPNPTPGGTGIIAAATWPSAGARKQYNVSAMNVALTISGPITIVAGSLIKPGSPSTQDIQIVAFDQNLGVLWTASFDNAALTGNDVSVGVAADGQHAVVVGNSDTPQFSRDIVVLVYDVQTGNPVGAPIKFNSPTGGDDFAAGVAMDEDTPDRFYVGGTSYNSTLQTRIYRAIAYDIGVSSVTPAWTSTFDTPSVDDAAAAVASNPKTNAFYITGAAMPVTSFQVNTDYLTVRFNKFSGAVDWAVLYNGPDSGEDLATAIATQALSGAHGGGGVHHYVYVTGRSHSGALETDMATIRYEDLFESSGAVHEDWVGRFHRVPDGGSDDRGVALVSHSETPVEVFVTGQSRSNSGDFDYVTMRYDDSPPGPTGKDPVWALVSGLIGTDDVPAGIAYSRLFAPGPTNAFVGGRSVSTTTGNDFLTIRADGP